MTHTPRLVTRREAADILGYSYGSLGTLMSRHPDRWPQPVDRVRGPRGHIIPRYSLAALRKAAGVDSQTDDPLDGAASLSGADGLIICLECGRKFRGLGSHLRVHGINAAEYRALHHLPATGSTHSDISRRMSRDTHRALIAADPTILDPIRPYWTRERLAMLAARATEAVRDSYRIPLAQEHRLPGQRYAVSRMVEQRLAKLDRAAREHGYADAADAIASTLDMSAKGAARATGLSAQTITRRRQSREASGIDGSHTTPDDTG